MMEFEQIQAQLNELLNLLSQLLLNPAVLICSVIVVVLVYKNQRYKKGAYYQVTRNPYSSIKRNKGKYAEYLTYRSLCHFEKNGGKFLFNILVPKEYGGTTEIDALLICSKGLFIFECKNYSGWIFGNEAQKSWTQTLPQGRGRSRKERFYNPIMQNASHMKHLKNVVCQNAPMHSIIVFSDRCTLKNVTVKSNDAKVINHYKVASVVAQICNQTPTGILTETEVNDIYGKLYPYTQFGYDVKKQHVENIRKML